MTDDFDKVFRRHRSVYTRFQQVSLGNCSEILGSFVILSLFSISRREMASTSSSVSPSSSSVQKTFSSGLGESSVAGEDCIYQFKVTLHGVKPPVWRRVVVENVSFTVFHEIINSALGWKNYHLYQFIYKNAVISERVEDDVGFPDSTFPFGLFGLSRSMELDSNETMIKDLFKDKGVKTLTYVYDFGDNWRHKVTLEKMLPREEGQTYPRCITGRRACPPEDCGGVYGYYSLLRKLAAPTHDEHEELKNWMEENGHDNFDPSKFDVKDVNLN